MIPGTHCKGVENLDDGGDSDRHLQDAIARLPRTPDIAGLSSRQARRLVQQLAVIFVWSNYRYAARVEQGGITRTLAGFLEAASPRWGCALPVRTFNRWLQTMRTTGVVGLIDGRGRGRSTRPLDAGLWRELHRLTGGGMRVQTAYRRLAERAQRERRRWPSLSTVRKRLVDGRVRLYLDAGKRGRLERW